MYGHVYFFFIFFFSLFKKFFIFKEKKRDCGDVPVDGHSNTKIKKNISARIPLNECFCFVLVTGQRCTFIIVYIRKEPQPDKRPSERKKRKNLPHNNMKSSSSRIITKGNIIILFF